MDKGKQDTLLGLVFFGGLALLLWATYSLTDISLAEKPTLEVVTANAGGLRAGDAVFVLGSRAGQVQRIDYVPTAPTSQRIRMVIQLNSPIPLRRDATVRIDESNLLGGRQIEIDPGSADEAWPPGVVLEARLTRNGIAALGEMLDAPDMQSDFRRIVTGVRDFFEKLNRPEGTIGRLINESGLYDEMLGVATSLRNSLEELEQGQGVLGRVIYDREMGADARRLVADAAEIVSDARAGRGTVGLLLRDEELAANVDRMLRGFADLAERSTIPVPGSSVRWSPMPSCARRPRTSSQTWRRSAIV
jgi:phospholipid/cholesterol/gamma-HCH transport system substrate-binding protein